MEVETRLVFPGLSPLYRRLAPYGYALLRAAGGLIMMPHGAPKLFGSFAPILAKNVLAPLGFPAPLAWAYWLGTLEVFGGAMLALGLFTRPLAAMFAVESAIIALFVAWPKGWFYSAPGGGFEYPLMLFVIFLVILVHGGGRLALDRIIGWEV